MFSSDDTIVAIATPAGRGGIGVVRISGPRAADVAAAILTREAPLVPRQATFTRVRTHDDATAASVVDAVVATRFPGPRSYTGEDVVEISAHGSPVVLRAIVGAAQHAGARLARPGEFTLRAFLNGKFDLVQAESVGDLVDAVTPLQARIAFDQLQGTLTARIAEVDRELFDLIARLEASLDFPEEGYHFVEPSEVADQIGQITENIDGLLASARAARVIREGATVVLAGRPNTGKSSLFNALAGFDRAIVTDVPGTTRDLITEQIDIDGVAVTLVDTAGTRNPLEAIEREGVTRGARARAVADLVLLVIDGSEEPAREDRQLLEETALRPRLIVASKADLPQRMIEGALRVSARTGEGIDQLRTAIATALTGGEPLRDAPMVSNMRHIELLAGACEHLRRAREAAASGTAPEEFVLADLQHARARFDEVVGKRTSDDLLRHIFERFCIGK